MLPTASDLWSIGPRLWLAGLGLLVLLVALFPAPGRKVAAGAIAVGGLLLTLIPASAMLAWDPRTAFFGSYAGGGVAGLFKILTAIAPALVTLAAALQRVRQPDELRPGGFPQGEPEEQRGRDQVLPLRRGGLGGDVFRLLHRVRAGRQHGPLRHPPAPPPPPPH